ncbi:MAG: hypothetical protein ABJA94_09030 [Rhodoglobus sp.]
MRAAASIFTTIAIIATSFLGAAAAQADSAAPADPAYVSPVDAQDPTPVDEAQPVAPADAPDVVDDPAALAEEPTGDEATGTPEDFRSAARFVSPTYAPAPTSQELLPAVSPIAPANNSYIAAHDFDMSWTNLGTGIYYQIYSTTIEPTTPIIQSPINGGLDHLADPYSIVGVPDATYWWQVRAKNADGDTGPWSSIVKVTVDTVKPTNPLPLTPGGWTVSSDEFTWTASTDASPVTYEVVTGDHPNLDADGRMTTNPVSIGSGIVGTSLMSSLPTGPKFWQVRATDAAGNKSAWSAPYGTQIIGVPAIAAPLDGAVLTGTSVAGSWTGVFGILGVASYQVEYGIDSDHDGSLEHSLISVPGTQLNRVQRFPANYTGPLSMRVRAVYNLGFSPHDASSNLGPWSALVSYSRINPLAQVCVPVAGWSTEDRAPVTTAAGLLFDGPHSEAVDYYQRVSAGNAQGLNGMTYTIAPGATGYGAQLVVEVNPNADLGHGEVTYTTLSTSGNPSSGIVDAQNGLWYASRIDYNAPGGQGHPLSWSSLIALMPNNTLLSAPSLHLQTASLADSHSVVTSVSSSCGTTDFTTPAAVSPAATSPVDPGARGGGGTAGAGGARGTTGAAASSPAPTVNDEQLVTEAFPVDDPPSSPKLAVAAAGFDLSWLVWVIGALLLLLALIWFLRFRRSSSASQTP